MDERPRNLKTMLSEAKDTSELMIDLGYAAVYFGDTAMAEEVEELEDQLSDLIHEMRAICVLAARSPRDADAMASVLQVVSAIERLGNAAVDIARIVTRRLGIPRALVADLSQAEEISHRVRVPRGLGHGPPHAGRPGAAGRGRDAGGRAASGSGVEHRDRRRHGAATGRRPVPPGGGGGHHRAAATGGGAGVGAPHAADEVEVSDLDRAIDVLVEMKNISEVAVGLAYSALVLRDQGLAAEVNHLEDRLDEMMERLELWVLRAAQERVDPSGLRGLMHLAQAAEEIGDAAQQMVWLIEQGEEVHPILALALGDADEVVVRVPVAAGSQADGRTLRDLCLETETGFFVLAIRRGGRYVYRPRPTVALEPDDELIATGPDEGHHHLAALCGYELISDDETGEDELVPTGSASRW